MNPQGIALQKLQQPTPTIPMPTDDPNAPTGVSPTPAGDVGHGFDMSSIQQAFLQQKQASQSAQAQETKGAIDYQQLKKKGFSPTQIESYLQSNPGVTLKNAPTNWDANIKQNTIIPKAAPLTERYGQIQPNVEVFSGGITTGTGIGVKAGTPLATPPGKWKVVETYDQAPQKGYIGNSAGQGWGNNILLQNQQTGEMLRYSHLSEVGVAQGDEISGSRVIGLSGQSGNTTGDHLNLQYITPQGQSADVLQSQYAQYIPIAQ